ncbi:hypothetical protein PLICRDRAFT_420169 [Plicaturopsis crispa FD-325 SS-3]|nr:hypothetical protein PLICRDRAFT_420169 [Plicaturopsis crispa FD-325 SS-3]
MRSCSLILSLARTTCQRRTRVFLAMQSGSSKSYSHSSVMQSVPGETSPSPNTFVQGSSTHDPENTTPLALPEVKKRTKRPHSDSPGPGLGSTDPPWRATLGTAGYESKEQRLHDEIVAFASYIMPTQEEKRIRSTVIDKITQTITSSGRFRHPDTQVYLFGSLAVDLCLPDGDIDLALKLPDVRRPNETKRSLFALQRILIDNSITDRVDVRHFARVPIVQFKTAPRYGSIKVDIGINNGDGIDGIAPMKAYMREFPALRPLVLVLKMFLVHRGMADASTSGLSSYTVFCMVASFLQLNPTSLPQESISNPLESESLGTLLLGFLSYYGHDFP